MTLRKETVASFIYLVGALYFMAIFQVWADEMNQGSKSVLPDVGFNILPYIKNFVLADIYVHLYFVITLVRVWFTQNRQTAYRRIMWVMGTLYLLRSFTISFTVLPTPYEGCEIVSHLPYNTRPSPFKTAFRIVTFQHSTCGDVLYSGHTMVLTTSAILWHVYTNSLILKALAWIVTLFGMFIIIATHFHYSDDVIIAFFLTILAYFIYHWGLWLGRLHRCGANVPFGWIGNIILIADGTDHYHYCSSECKHYKEDINQYNNNNIMVTPPYNFNSFFNWIRTKLKTDPIHEINLHDESALHLAAKTYDHNIGDNMQDNIIGGNIRQRMLNLAIDDTSNTTTIVNTVHIIHNNTSNNPAISPSPNQTPISIPYYSTQQ